MKKFNDILQDIEKVSKETQPNEEAKIKTAILLDNACRAFFAENIKKICDIWNKYEGKKHGEKTRGKIRDEFIAAVGCLVCVEPDLGNTCIRIRFDSCGCLCLPSPIGQREIFAFASGEPTDEENKIKKLSPEGFRLYWVGEYVEDVDAFVKGFYNAREELRALSEKLREAIRRYNSFTRGDMQDACFYNFPTRFF